MEIQGGNSKLKDKTSREKREMQRDAKRSRVKQKEAGKGSIQEKEMLSGESPFSCHSNLG